MSIMPPGGVGRIDRKLIHRSAWNRFSEVHIQDPEYPCPYAPRITPTSVPHSPAPLELVTPMDSYARSRMLPWRKQMSAFAIISEGRSDPSHTLFRGSGRGKARAGASSQGNSHPTRRSRTAAPKWRKQRGPGRLSRRTSECTLGKSR
jgi:hypothetical protein